MRKLFRIGVTAVTFQAFGAVLDHYLPWLAYAAVAVGIDVCLSLPSKSPNCTPPSPEPGHQE